MLRPSAERMQEGAMATTPVGDTPNALDPRVMHPAMTNLEFPKSFTRAIRSNQRAIQCNQWVLIDEP